MKTKIEVVIGDGDKRPTVKQINGKWVVLGESAQVVTYGRAVWVRTFAPDNGTLKSQKPVDGKGFLVGPTRRLTKG